MKGVLYIEFETLSKIFSILIAISIIPCLVNIVGTIVLYDYVKKHYDLKFKYVIKPYWFSYFLMIIFILISIIFNESFSVLLDKIMGIVNTMKFDRITDLLIYIIKVPSPVVFAIWGGIIGTMLLYNDSIRFNRNSEIIKNEKRKNNQLDDYRNVPLDYTKNILIVGKNGSGKTVAISNFVKKHIENGEFCVIIDGKGDVGQYSLYDIVTKLCKKNERKIYIINQSLPNETNAYNPFIGCNATQIKDMLINMSEWSEEHYKAKASEYFQALAQFLLDVKIPISFNTLTQYAFINNWSSALNMYKSVLDKEDIDYYYRVIANCGEDVEGAVSRFSTVSKGIGKMLFRDDNTFNLQKAYDENAVVLVLLNNLEYTDFARGVGMLVLNDIKNVLGKVTKIKGEHKPFLCVYDELSVYFSIMITDIVNKSRSLGGTNILSTQSIADMDIVDENARRIVITNTHGFFLLKQADDKSAETLSNAIGTIKSTQITSKLDSFGKTGDGTSKIVDEYLVHPNVLKNLPLGVGYWIDTLQDDYKAYRVKMPYVDVSDIEDFKFNG